MRRRNLKRKSAQRKTGTRRSVIYVAVLPLCLCVSFSCLGAELNTYEKILEAAQENNPGVYAAYHVIGTANPAFAS